MHNLAWMCSRGGTRNNHMLCYYIARMSDAVRLFILGVNHCSRCSRLVIQELVCCYLYMCAISALLCSHKSIRGQPQPPQPLSTPLETSHSCGCIPSMTLIQTFMQHTSGIVSRSGDTVQASRLDPCLGGLLFLGSMRSDSSYK